MSMELLASVQQNLKKRGFGCEIFATGAEAAAWVLSQIPEGASIGVGGSVTIRDLKIADTLRDTGHPVYWHWYVPGPETLHKANNADVYLASSNAVTKDGILVNIDGTGNRVAAMAYGPGRVYLVCGINKLVEGGIPQAIARIKHDACPPNARRLGKDTSCALTGRCDAANCKRSMCNVTSVLDRPTGGHPITVVLADEVLGY